MNSTIASPPLLVEGSSSLLVDHAIAPLNSLMRSMKSKPTIIPISGTTSVKYDKTTQDNLFQGNNFTLTNTLLGFILKVLNPLPQQDTQNTPSTLMIVMTKTYISFLGLDNIY